MTLTIIGAGKMGEALARGILSAGLIPPPDLIVTDIDTSRLDALTFELGVIGITDAHEAVANASLIILAVKPKDIATVCRAISAAVPEGATILTIAAGVTLHTVADALNRDDLILARAMPNTPALVSAGAFGLSFSERAPLAARKVVRDLLSPIGLVEEVPESLLDAVTGLSGSGPAYIAMLIEALADGGVLVGLPRVQAERLATQTVLGTAKLIMETHQHPGQVKDAVSSPGGTTIAGVQALEDRGFRAAIMAAVTAATMRARELSGE